MEIGKENDGKDRASKRKMEGLKEEERVEKGEEQVNLNENDQAGPSTKKKKTEKEAPKRTLTQKSFIPEPITTNDIVLDNLPADQTKLMTSCSSCEIKKMEC